MNPNLERAQGSPVLNILLEFLGKGSITLNKQPASKAQRVSRQIQCTLLQ